jgi:hypothetical protein
MASLQFTRAERRRLARKAARAEAELIRIAALPPEESGRAADALWRRNVTQPGVLRRARLRVRTLTRPNRPRRTVLIARSRAAVRTTTPSRGDPNDPDPDPDRGLRRNGDGWIPCPFCGAPIVEAVDGDHCGGCAITWWSL